MILRDCLVRFGIVDSPRLCALKPAAQLFFRNMLHVCDGAGRFEADADRLRTVLYGRSLHVVGRRDVARWMAECHTAGLIRLYTRDGRGYGEVLNYGQRDTKRRVLYPPPDDDQLNFSPAPPPTDLFTGDEDPPDPAPRRRRNEVKGRESPPSPPPGGADSFAGGTEKASAPRRRRSPERTLATAREELADVEQRMMEILRPGGCAYNVEPTGENLVRFRKLEQQRAALKAAIEKARNELQEETTP